MNQADNQSISHSAYELQMFELIEKERQYATKNLSYFQHHVLPGDLIELERPAVMAPNILFAVLSVDEDRNNIMTYSLNNSSFVLFVPYADIRTQWALGVVGSTYDSFSQYRTVSYQYISYKLNVLFTKSRLENA